MQNSDTNGSDSILYGLAGIGIFGFLLILVIWGVCGWIAWIVAPDDRRLTFFWLTFLLFGPLGILAAAVASPRSRDDLAEVVAQGVEDAVGRPRAKGRVRYWCARCGAQSDFVQVKDKSCWRCGEKQFIADKS
jgi:DNA-directed RNA polymerase subunit RPC12/RpoP